MEKAPGGFTGGLPRCGKCVLPADGALTGDGDLRDLHRGTGLSDLGILSGYPTVG
jgi:hypothetical protein